jgi:hypothetical protein
VDRIIDVRVWYPSGGGKKLIKVSSRWMPKYNKGFD